YVNLAEPYAESSKDPEIQRELIDLKHAWASLKATGNRSAGGAAQSDEDAGLPSTERKKRAVGRPPGSGSLERGDLKLVAEMRKGILSGKFLSTAAAARELASKAGGFGTVSSKEKRLSNRYSDQYPS